MGNKSILTQWGCSLLQKKNCSCSIFPTPGLNLERGAKLSCQDLSTLAGLDSKLEGL
jgi:hypothetical protein